MPCKYGLQLNIWGGVVRRQEDCYRYILNEIKKNVLAVDLHKKKKYQKGEEFNVEHESDDDRPAPPFFAREERTPIYTLLIKEEAEEED